MEQVTNAYLLLFTDNSCLENYSKIYKKYLFGHHFGTEEEEGVNCVMPPAVLAFLLIVYYPLISIGVLCGYLPWSWTDNSVLDHWTFKPG